MRPDETYDRKGKMKVSLLVENTTPCPQSEEVVGIRLRVSNIPFRDSPFIPLLNPQIREYKTNTILPKNSKYRTAIHIRFLARAVQSNYPKSH